MRVTRTKFARVCVEIKPDFKCPIAIPVDLGTRMSLVKAAYRWKPVSCVICCSFGHNSLNAQYRKLGRISPRTLGLSRVLQKRTRQVLNRGTHKVMVW